MHYFLNICSIHLVFNFAILLHSRTPCEPTWSLNWFSSYRLCIKRKTSSFLGLGVCEQVIGGGGLAEGAWVLSPLIFQMYIMPYTIRDTSRVLTEGLRITLWGVKNSTPRPLDGWWFLSAWSLSPNSAWSPHICQTFSAFEGWSDIRIVASMATGFETMTIWALLIEDTMYDLSL